MFPLNRNKVFGDEGYGTPADVFSLGVLIWEVFTRGRLENPLCGLAGEACRKSLMDGLRPSLSPTAPVEMNDLIERCWSFDPRKRPTADAVAAELRAFADDTVEAQSLD